METAGHEAFLKVRFLGREETTVRNSVTPGRLVRREALKLWSPPGWAASQRATQQAYAPAR